MLPHQRRMTGGLSLNGGIWLEFDGQGRIELRPDQAFALAAGIMRNLGINVEYEYDGPKVQA
jgi:hypothetical protein